MLARDLAAFEEGARKEKALRRQNPLGESLTIKRPPKTSPHERLPTFGTSPLTMRELGLLEVAPLAQTLPSVRRRHTEYADEFDMVRINALVLEERAMLRACGLDERGRYTPPAPVAGAKRP